MTEQWYNVLKACFGHSIAKAEDKPERMVWYSTILERTGAENDEICKAIKWASKYGKKSSLQHGRVSAEDVIKWVRAERGSSSGDEWLSYTVQEFLCRWNEWLGVGSDSVENMEREADGLDLSQKTIAEIKARVLSERMNGRKGE